MINTKITCKRCGVSVNVPGKKPDFRCDNCNVSYWGYQQLIDLPVSNAVKKELLTEKSPLSDAEREWLRKYRKVSDQKRQEATNDASQTVPVKRQESKPVTAKPSLSTASVVGWLIVKTEGKQVLDFPLVEGDNYIGRSFSSYTPHINIEDDRFVSRFHALLKVRRKQQRPEIVLTDNENNVPKGQTAQSRASRNGCFLNGNVSRMSSSERWALADGDTIQIGETKLVLKVKEVTSELDEARTQVLNQDFEKTVIIRDKQSAEPVKPDLPEIPAWLVVGDAEVPTAYALKIGENFIGRRYGKDELLLDLEFDHFVSRFHIRISITLDKDNSINYYLFDDDKNPLGKSSTAGTYINGKVERLGLESSTLTKGDVIQIGKTRLVFLDDSAGQSEQEVLEQAKVISLPALVNFYI